ncbi:hypothetical protein [Amycolatopsis vancoresmycina]|uniref:hypothetical protein n=1 Tax=Amycolatopsis vancoresmycina TaxID=208444 RepID=UPI000524145F|nr:hypothetical protein [Amycolatopsis vancoresmycina]
MSTLRRLAVAGAFALPLSLVIAGPATAHPLDWPNDSWSAESSSAWAGIGGAGTTDTDEGGTWWGHHWSGSDSAVAGVGGASVTETEESGDHHWNQPWHHATHDGWYGDDNDYDGCGCNDYDNNDNGYDHHVVHHAVSHPDPVEEAPAAHSHPAYDNNGCGCDDYDNNDNGYDHNGYDHHNGWNHDNDYDHDASYGAETHSAGIDGATSGHVWSHAGEHYATYEAEKLTAGPNGASSEGAHSVAVPDYAGHHSWYTAAGIDGAEAHSVTAEANANDDDAWAYHDADNDYDYDQG